MIVYMYINRIKMPKIGCITKSHYYILGARFAHSSERKGCFDFGQSPKSKHLSPFLRAKRAEKRNNKNLLCTPQNTEGVLSIDDFCVYC
jgi:hypothetical protein